MTITAETVAIDIIARLDRAEGDIGRFDTQFANTKNSLDRSAKALEGIFDRLSEKSAGSFRKAGQATSQAANDIDKNLGRAANATRNLGRQVADVGTQLAGGQNPFLIFAQQAPQIADALADTGGRAAKVAMFFAGPWGAALLAAGSALGLLIPKLFEADKSAEELRKHLADAAKEADSFGIAQSELGQIMDLVTGKLKTHNTVLLEYIRLQAEAAKQSALKDLNEGNQDLSKVETRPGGSRAFLAALSRNPGAFQDKSFDSPQLRNYLSGVQSGAIGNATEARKQLEALEKAGRTSGHTFDELWQKVLRVLKARNDIKAQDEVVSALDGKGVSPDLKPYKDTSRQDAAKAEKAARAQFEAGERLRALQSELVSAQSDLTSDTRQQDQYARERIDLDRQSQVATINESRRRGEITASEVQARVKLVNAIEDSRLDLVNRNESIRYAGEQLAAALAKVGNQREIAQAEDALATTAKDRRIAETKLLELQLQEIRLRAQSIVDLAKAGKATPEEGGRAQATLDTLPALKTLGEKKIQEKTLDPFDAYRKSLNRTKAELGEDFQRVGVNALQDFNSHLDDSISKALHLHGVLGDVIRDLIDMAAKQLLLKPIVNALGSGGGIGGFFSSLASNFQGARASGGPVSAGGTYLVGERGPELLRMGGQHGLIVPNHAIPAMGNVRASMPVVTNVRNFNISVSADNSVPPAGFARGLAEDILQRAAQMDARTFQAGQAAAPDRLRRIQVLGS